MKFFCFLFLLSIVISSEEIELISRDDFPNEFVFGSGTSAYQVEGAASEDGRSPSIWDTSTHTGHAQGATADVTSDGYHKYKEDIKLMKETGLEGYRFSISWSRLIPDGRGKINPKGLQFYNNFIDELISNGIQPHASLLHFDTPQVLEDEYESFLSPKIIDDFTAYANVCFREFGDRVTHWGTINEANAFALGGYDDGFMPPNRCSKPFGDCPKGNSALEPYIVAHHLLLAHSSVVSLYKKVYQSKQKGVIGLNLILFNFIPKTNSQEDLDAQRRAFDFYSGWFIEPLVRGDYPSSMKLAAGNKMPRFTKRQSNQLINSFDFFGLNYYLTMKVKNVPNDAPTDQKDVPGDAAIDASMVRTKKMGTFNVTLMNLLSGLVMEDRKGNSEKNRPIPNANGMQKVLEYMKQTYGNPPIYIHENGLPTPSNASLHDTRRIDFITKNLESLRDAIRNGSNTKGYFTWSFIDVFEFPIYGPGGYETTFGLYHVNFTDVGRKRTPRLSAKWYSSFLHRETNVNISSKLMYLPQVS